MIPKVLLVHPGTQYSHQIAKQLFRKKILFYFITGYTIAENSLLVLLLKKYFPLFHRKLSNRIIQHIPNNKLKTFPFHEIKSLIKIKGNASEKIYFERNNIFQHKIAKNILSKSSIVIGFDTSSLVLIKRANELNKPFILDVSIAHSITKNKIYNTLVQVFPEWAQFIELKEPQYIELEQQEFINANALVVASKFTMQTLIDQGINPSKIFINPYGINLDDFALKQTYSSNNNIKFIFIGLVDVRKGIPFLLNTWKKINSSSLELSLVGSITDDVKNIITDKFSNLNITIQGKIPHSELPVLLVKHDVFIFPTYFEGFGLVILEAMACGLPVITTTASAGPDIIENGKEGFIIEAGDEIALTNAINFFIDNPTQIEIMGRAARKKAAQYSWDAYGERWEKIIQSILLN